MKATRGICIEITDRLTSQSAHRIAQWIGGYTVIRNQKTSDNEQAYRAWIKAGQPEDDRPVINAAYASISKREYLGFLTGIPSQIRRNAASKWFEHMNAALLGIRKPPRIKGKKKRRNCYVTNELFDTIKLDDDRSLIQLKESAKKGARYFVGVVVLCPIDSIGKALYLTR